MADTKAPAPEPAPTTSAKSPWPILIPVLVGVGALLIGGVIGGAAGFGLGSRLGHGPHIELQLPGDQRGGPLQNGPFDGDRGDRGPDGDHPRLERGGTPTGDVVPLPGVAEQG